MGKQIGNGKTLHKLKEISELSYEDYCSDNKLSDEIIDRWRRLGLLEGLGDNITKECAYCYEKMAVYLIYGKDLVEADEQFETAVFDTKEFETFYYDNIEKCNNVVKEMGAVDEEAETLCLLCKQYIVKVK